MAGKTSWGFAEGDEMVPGRRAVHLLGGGVRAEAWVCWDERLHALVVAKLLRPSHVDDPAAREALAREARVLAALQHPAIVRLFDAQLDGPRPHLVLESLDGPRLSTLVRRFGALAPEQLVPLGLELAHALAFMHDGGYIHLDLKPRNLVVAATPRLIDFGAVRTLDELAALSAPVGTPAWMAPEQASVDTIRRAGPPVDVWGLGLILHVAATGSHPFPGRQPAAPLPSLDTAALERRLPAPLPQLIGACLAADPARRPAAADVGEALEPLVPGSRRVARRRLRARIR